MHRYIGFLRGVNVGGKGLVKMVDLKAVLDSMELENVRTYIQSGNIIFSSSNSSTGKLASSIKATVKKHFDLEVGVIVFSSSEWAHIIDQAPSWWGANKDWKHNLLILIEPYDRTEIDKVIASLKPNIESMEAGKRVIYQSMSLEKFGQTSSSNLISSPIYKRVTIRNYNTATKLLSLVLL